MRFIPVLLCGLASLTAARPGDKRGTPIPNKDVLCVGYENEDEACKSDFRACWTWLGYKHDPDSGQMSKRLDTRRPGRPSAADAGAQVLKADIRVDTNRDGVVDVVGSSDEEGKNDWTDTSGGIFLANIGDSDNRCRKRYPGEPQKNIWSFSETLFKCHDADDETQRAPYYMAPMRTMPIKGLSETATASVTVPDVNTRSLVRIFRATANETWEIVNDNTTFSAQEVQQGLTLGIDARDTRREGGWDGRVSVEFTAKDGQSESRDTAMLRVAPVLLHHNRQSIQRVFTSGFPASRPETRASMDRIVQDIEKSMEPAHVPGPITRIDTDDAWAQDYFEAAYTSMPGPNGTAIALRIMLEGRNTKRYRSIALPYTSLRGDGVGAIAAGRRLALDKTSTGYNAGGNLESIPPYELGGGQKFPHRRVIVGGDGENAPRSLDFFKAQEMQAPIVVDSTWLKVGHVDEMFQAVPAKTDRGWAILALDPAEGLELLRDAAQRGSGGQPVINCTEFASSPTIEQFVNEPSVIQAAELGDQRMAANIDVLKKETGVTDAEIFRVPAIMGTYETIDAYKKRRGPKRRMTIERRDRAANASSSVEPATDLNPCFGDEEEEDDDESANLQGRQTGQSEPTKYASLLPNLVNGLSLSDSSYLASKQFGPLIDGEDIFEAAAAKAFKDAGLATVEFVDEWDLNMVYGNLHSFTNAFRDASQPWW
ncbi:hypothetical protein V2A60_009674 [Cordyceps javanica]